MQCRVASSTRSNVRTVKLVEYRTEPQLGCLHIYVAGNEKIILGMAFLNDIEET